VSGLAESERRWLRIQRATSRLLSPLWIPIFVAIMGCWMRWRIENVAEIRAEYRKLRAAGGPLLVCANHLTMLDSFLVGWALGGMSFYLRDFSALPWNTPERVHFASTWWKQILAYVLKCVPVTRGADRGEVAKVLEKVRYLMERGEVVLIFPEAGRSRSARVEPDSAAYGVGRLVNALPDCRVACVYLRGEGQDAMSDAPARGEHFYAALSSLEPKSDFKGLRASLDVSRQIVARLIEMEQRYFDDRE